MKNNAIKIAVPSGILRNQTIKLFEAAGYDVKLEENLYTLQIDDPEIKCILERAQEITHNVERGDADAGITEKAFILDHKVDVIEIANLAYGPDIFGVGNAKIVLAVPENSKIRSVKDLKGKKILARVPEIAKEYLKKYKVKANVEWTDRPAEPKIPMFGDAIVEFTNTGETLRAHHLRVLDVLMETSTLFIANKKAWRDKWKREKIENLAMLLNGASLAQIYSGIMLHIPKSVLKNALSILPALKKPTITPLQGEPLVFDVFTITPKKKLRVLLPQLKKLGCTDIVEFPLSKVVL